MQQYKLLWWKGVVCRLEQWTISMDGGGALFRLVCRVEPDERMDEEIVGGRICCVWMALMVLCC